MAEPKATIGLTAEDLKDVLKAVIEESRKPVVTDREQKEIETRQHERQLSVDQLLEMRRNEEWIQNSVCSHRRRDHTPRTVHVRNEPKSGGEFMVCQKCQKVIRPELEPALFNALVIDHSAVMD